jgi:hypothetical protein
MAVKCEAFRSDLPEEGLEIPVMVRSPAAVIPELQKDGGGAALHLAVSTA